MKNVFTIFLIFILFEPGFILSQSTCPENMITYWKLDEFGGVNKFRDSYGGYFAYTSDTSRPVQDVGIVGQARKFDNKSEITVPDDSVFHWDANTSFSIELWVKIPKVDPGTNVFIGKYFSGSKASWYVANKGNVIVFVVSDSNGIETTLEGNKNIIDGNWHHIAAVENDSINVLQIYVDGQQDAIQTTFFTGDFTNTGQITIGFYNNGFHFIGSLDEIAIYNKALNQNEIMQHYNNGLNGKGYCELPTDIRAENNAPGIYMLSQNFPNPFNPTTTISYTIPKESAVTIKVYDILGRLIATLVNKRQLSGKYSVNFNGTNLNSGVYFYKFKSGEYIQTKEMILLK